MCGYCFVRNYFVEADNLIDDNIYQASNEKNNERGIDLEIEEVELTIPKGKVLYEMPQVYQENYRMPAASCFEEYGGIMEIFVAKFIESKFLDTDVRKEVLDFTSEHKMIECVVKSCETQRIKFDSIICSDMKVKTVFSKFAFLYDKDYYFGENIYASVDGIGILRTLKYYYEWWLKGTGIRILPDEEVSYKRPGVVFDPLDTRDEQASDLFMVLFRCFFYSLQVVSVLDVSSRYYIFVKNILGKIITTTPFMLPDFGALDLWILRIAIKKYAQSYGEFSKEIVENMIPSCVYYLCRHCDISETLVKIYFGYFKSKHCEECIESIDDIILCD